MASSSEMEKMGLSLHSIKSDVEKNIDFPFCFANQELSIADIPITVPQLQI